MRRAVRPAGTSRLLATDLDGTLVGDRAALDELLAMVAAAPRPWLLAYVTGRSLASARGLARAEGLPVPDVWITDVGAAIADASGRPDAAWEQALRRGWDRDAVTRVAAAWPALRPQPPTNQGPLKASYHLAPADAGLLPALGRALAEAGVDARLVYSSERDLDVLPAGAGKGGALRHVAARLGLAPARILACGDTGNDRDMLGHGGPAVAVGNAQRELLADLPAGVLRAGAPCAGGILEALRHFGWIEAPCPSS